MSGIFGICEPGRELRSELLLPMLQAQILPGESGRDVHGAMSVAFGVARRSSFQHLGGEADVLVAADADLVDLRPIADLLTLSANVVAETPIAQLLARLYLRKGPDFLKLLHGGFSLALWDEKARRLILAIDRMGIKSLYWRREHERLSFASRIGAIRAVQQGAPQANASAILQFLLFSAVPAPITSDQGTEKLRPGTSITFAADGITENQYWDFSYPESSNRSVSFWSKELREAIRSAVHRHLDRCEPSSTGCFLSGGTDSSSVVAFASERHKPVQSFSIAFEEAGYSEIDFARTTSAAFHTRHFEKFLKPPDAAAAIGRILDYYDEPFANSSAVGSYYCAQLAREHGVTTLLAGDGGDELFAGNERYAKDKQFALYHHLPSWLRKGVIEPVAGLVPLGDGKWSLPRRYISRAKLPNPFRILSYGFFLSYPADELFDANFLNLVGRDNWLSVPEQHFTRARASSELNRILYLDMKMTLADNDLRKVSGTAELAGVNVRYPFLDTQLTEVAGQIPSILKLKGFKKRYIFKEAMKNILPLKVLHKKKHGFGVPLSEWLLQDPKMKALMQDVIHDRETRQRGYFRADFFDRLAKLHSQQPNFYGEIVWYLLALELWHRKHLKQSRETVHVG